MEKETLLVIMPAYNEEVCIEETVSSWSKLVNNFPGSEILVINDGSTDKTKEKLDKLSIKIPFLRVIHKENEGHGMSIRLGYERAIKTRHDWIFQTDSDGHFTPSDFYKLWEKRLSSNFILGKRTERKDPLFRLALTWLASLYIYILFREYIKDPNIPFRLISRRYLENLIEKVPEDSFAPNAFLSILAKKDGQKLHHVPVKYKPRIKNHNKMKILKGSLQTCYQLLLFSP